MRVEDFDCIDRVLRGDTEAFSELVEKHQKPLYYTVLRILSEPEEAADIAQQAFINAYRSLATFKRESSFKTWLYQIAINLCRNRIGEKTRRPEGIDMEEVDIPDSAQLPFDQLDESYRSDHIRQAIAGLPEQQRLTVVLRIYDGHSYEQIADLLGCAPETARVHFHYAIKNLRKGLKGI